MITLKINEKELQFEHSLVSLSDWEAEFQRPFFSPINEPKTDDEFLKYFEYMLVGSKKHRHLLILMTQEQKIALVNYIAEQRTATTVREIQNKPGSRENVTSELIYYWLVAFKIPFKPTDEWHLNRLLMLVKVTGAKQAPAPKQTPQSRAKLAMSMRELNEQRLRERNTSG